MKLHSRDLSPRKLFISQARSWAEGLPALQTLSAYLPSNWNPSSWKPTLNCLALKSPPFEETHLPFFSLNFWKLSKFVWTSLIEMSGWEEWCHHVGVVTAVLIITYTIPPPPLHHFIQCTPDATTLYTVYILQNEARTMYELINDQLINGRLLINGWIMIGAIWLPNNPVSTCGAINHLVLPPLTPEGLNLLNISSYPQYDDLMKG